MEETGELDGTGHAFEGMDLYVQRSTIIQMRGIIQSLLCLSC